MATARDPSTEESGKTGAPQQPPNPAQFFFLKTSEKSMSESAQVLLVLIPDAFQGSFSSRFAPP